MEVRRFKENSRLVQDEVGKGLRCQLVSSVGPSCIHTCSEQTAGCSTADLINSETVQTEYAETYLRRVVRHMSKVCPYP